MTSETSGGRDRAKADPDDPLDPEGDIGRRLRALYAEIEHEPIPTALIELLERLDQAETRSKQR